MSTATLETREMTELNDTVVVVAPTEKFDAAPAKNPAFQLVSSDLEEDFITAFAEFIGKATPTSLPFMLTQTFTL